MIGGSSIGRELLSRQHCGLQGAARVSAQQEGAGRRLWSLGASEARFDGEGETKDRSRQR